MRDNLRILSECWAKTTVKRRMKRSLPCSISVVDTKNTVPDRRRRVGQVEHSKLVELRGVLVSVSLV